MDQVERTFFGRAYGMDIRVDKHKDGTLSVYEAFPYSGLYVFVLRADRETVIKRFDVSGSVQNWLERN
jgi:hypothetical protein